MKGGTQIALGLAGGYVLGRFHKTRLLTLVAAALATRKIAEEMAGRGGQIGGTPEIGKLTELGREAAVAIVSNRIEGLTEKIHARTESLRQAAGEGEEGAEPEEPEAEAEGEEEEEPEEPEAEAEGEEEEEEEPEEPEAEAEGEEEKPRKKAAKKAPQPKAEKAARKSPGARRPESRRRATESRTGRSAAAGRRTAPTRGRDRG